MNDILSTINSSRLQHLLLPVKILFIVFSLILFFAIIYFLATTQYLRYLFLEEWQELMSWKGSHRKKRKRDKKRKKEKPKEIKERQPYLAKKTSERKMSEWERIENRIKRGGKLGYKLGLLDADKFLNRVLGELKIKGEDLEEKLNNLPAGFVSNIEELRGARKFINRILENEDFEVEREKAEAILKQFKKALLELKAI